MNGIFKQYNAVSIRKYDSVNKCTQEIGESMKLHILGCHKMPMKFMRQLAKLTCIGFLYGSCDQST